MLSILIAPSDSPPSDTGAVGARLSTEWMVPVANRIVANRHRKTVCFKRKLDHSEDTVVHDKKEKEKRLDDSCQCIKTPVGKDADSVQGCEGSTMSWRRTGRNTMSEMRWG